MRNSILILLLGFTFQFLSGQSAVGTWKTIDDEDGKVKSYVEIYEKDGKLFGKVKEVLDPSSPKLCSSCKGDKKDQPLVGMEILWDLKKKGDGWSGGKIMDPKNGKTYKCKMSLEGNDQLKVRGFIGFSLIGRTQTWYRAE